MRVKHPLMLAAVLLVAAVQPAGARSVRIEAEAGTIDNPYCDMVRHPGDREVMQAKGIGNASMNAAVTYPGAGCSLALNLPAGAHPVAARIQHSGVNGQVYCGYFELSGGAIGTTAVTCTGNETPWYPVPVYATPVVGPVVFTWRIDNTAGESTTPTWANADLDYLAVS